MADPFQSLQDQGISTFGIDVLDAPDQRLREISLMAQQGQALNPRDARRLAQRQGIELETARRAREVTGFGGAGVPVSTVDYLAGSRLDPRVQQATAAEAVLASNPLMQQARLQQAEDILNPVKARMREAGFTESGALTPEASLLADYSVALKDAESLGTDVRSAYALRRPMGEIAPISPSSFELPAPADAGQDEGPSTAASRVERKVARAAAPNRDIKRVGEEAYNESMKWANDYTKQTGGIRPSVLQFQQRVAKTRDELAPREIKITERDDLTGDEYEVTLLADATGQRIYGSRGVSAGKRNPQFQKIDEDFVPEFNAWTSGKAAQTAADLGRLDTALNRMKTENVTGPLVGRAATFAPTKIFTDAFMPGVAATETDVISVGQNKIKEIFGSNPAQAEAQRLLDRIFDKNMPESENMRRVELFRDMLTEGAKAKAAKASYFERYGTLAGYKGPSEMDVVGSATSRLDNKNLGNPNVPKSAVSAFEAYKAKRKPQAAQP